MNVFDKILVRDTNTENWKPAFFESEFKDASYTYYKIIGSDIAYRQCIPYEGNENKLNKV